MTTPSILIKQLEEAFQEVYEKHMQDMPIINDKLEVKAIGFDSWNDYRLGVLITPWFMNLMLIPREANLQKHQEKMGEIQTHIFPSGAYEFVTGNDDAFGYYESCALFSPMFDFKDQQSAELAAQAVLKAIVTEKTEKKPEADKPLSERAKKPRSRRDFLRGSLFRRGSN